MTDRTAAVVPPERLREADAARAFRLVNLLTVGYATISVAALVAMVVMRHHPALVTPAAWVRGTIVVASALLTVAFARRMAAGSRRARLRLTIVTTVMIVAIAVIVALPGAFPVWLRVEQAVCGLVLISLAVVLHGRPLRTLFAA